MWISTGNWKLCNSYETVLLGTVKYALNRCNWIRFLDFSAYNWLYHLISDGGKTGTHICYYVIMACPEAGIMSVKWQFQKAPKCRVVQNSCKLADTWRCFGCVYWKSEGKCLRAVEIYTVKSTYQVAAGESFYALFWMFLTIESVKLFWMLCKTVSIFLCMSWPRTWGFLVVKFIINRGKIALNVTWVVNDSEYVSEDITFYPWIFSTHIHVMLSRANFQAFVSFWSLKLLEFLLYRWNSIAGFYSFIVAWYWS